MRMRITERLIHLMANELSSERKKSDGTTSKGVQAIDDLLASIGIVHLKHKEKKQPSSVYCVDQKGQIRGYELKLLFNSFVDGEEVVNDTWLKIANLEPLGDKTTKITTIDLWRSWNAIQKYLTGPGPFSDEQLTQLQQHLTDFGDAYVNRYTRQRVTPYVHILCAHLVEVLKKYKSVGIYAQEGFEATHKFHRRIFQRCSSHRGSRSRISSILQIFQRIYRTIKLRLMLNIAPQYSMTFPLLKSYVKEKKKAAYVHFNLII